MARALAAAHAKGLIHRDVKPGNVLIGRDGRVKVVDFGIARAVAEAQMTLPGTTLGSVHYFSPEQARGEPTTEASDIYSLGIVLYEMLTGVRPWTGDSAASVALARLTRPGARSDGRPIDACHRISPRSPERRSPRRPRSGSRPRARWPTRSRRPSVHADRDGRRDGACRRRGGDRLGPARTTRWIGAGSHWSVAAKAAAGAVAARDLGNRTTEPDAGSLRARGVRRR